MATDNKDQNLPEVPASGLGQQLIIAVLVIAVGVLFGMGPVIAILQGPAPAPLRGGISQVEAGQLQRTAENLQQIINPNPPSQQLWQWIDPGPIFVSRVSQGDARAPYADRLWLAQVAESEGLKPSGSDLRTLFDTWKLQTLPNSQTTFGSALARAREGRFAVTPNEVEYFIAVENGRQALFDRHVAKPGMSANLANTLFRQQRDRIGVSTVVLKAEPLIAEFLEASLADEDELQFAYEDMRDRFFALPANRTLTVFVADADTIAEKITASDEQLSAYYDEIKIGNPTYQNTETGKEWTEEMGYRSFATVKTEVKAAYQRKQAEGIASSLSAKLQNALIEKGLAGNPEAKTEDILAVAKAVQLTPEDNAQLSEPVGILIQDQVIAREPASGTRIDLGTFGAINQQELNLFADEMDIGFLSARYKPLEDASDATDRKSSFMFVLITGKAEASYEEFDKVKEQVARWQAARKAWPKLLEEAEALRQQALATEGGLAAVFADENLQEKWRTKVNSTLELEPLANVPAPTEDVDGIPEDQRFAIALGNGEPRAVLTLDAAVRDPDNVRADGIAGDMPSVRIVESTSYIGNDVYDPAQANYWKGQVDRLAESLLSDRYLQVLQGKLSDG